MGALSARCSTWLATGATHAAAHHSVVLFFHNSPSTGHDASNSNTTLSSALLGTLAQNTMADKETLRGSAMLLCIPAEIQFQILSLLVPSSLESVRAVLYTCKQLYNVALPLSVHTYQNSPSGEVRRPRSRSRNLGFLRYIVITKPDLARSVKSIALNSSSTGSGPKVDDNVQQPLGATSDEVAAYADRILDMFSSETDPLSYNWYLIYRELLEGIWNGVEDAEIALLLLFCSRLENLALGRPISLDMLLRLKAAGTDYQQPDQILPGSEGSNQLLSCLRSVYHEAKDIMPGYLGFSQLAEIVFQLPQIRSYECILTVGDHQTYRHFADIPKGSSPLEHITLRKSRVNSDTLHAMFDACNSLRSFEYIRGGSDEMEANEIRPRDLMSAVLIHAETLESLHANFEHGWQKAAWAEEEERKEELCMGLSLQKLLALKSLTMGMPALTGMTLDQIDFASSAGDSSPLKMEPAPTLLQCLPENLEDLQIHSCGPQILVQAQEFLDAVAAGKRFQKLKQIRLLFEEEQISHSAMALTCNKPDILIEVVTQALENREFDHCPYAMNSPRSVANTFMCSPMSARGDRELWLKYRGSNRGSASPVTGRVYDVPDA